MPGSEGDRLMPAKGRIIAAFLLGASAATAFALPRLLVRAQPRTQAERPPAAFATGPGPVKVIRVAPSLLVPTISPSFLSLPKHAQELGVVTIRQRFASAFPESQGAAQA